MGRTKVLLAFALVVIILATTACQAVAFVFTHEPDYKYQDSLVWSGTLVKGVRESQNDQQRNSWWGYYLIRTGEWDAEVENKPTHIEWNLCISYQLAPRVFILKNESGKEKEQPSPYAEPCNQTTPGCYQWVVISPSGKTYVVRAERNGGTENYNVSVSLKEN